MAALFESLLLWAARARGQDHPLARCVESLWGAAGDELVHDFQAPPDRCWQCREANATEDLSYCSGCRVARWCGQTCQKRAWKLHRRVCSGLALDRVASATFLQAKPVDYEYLNLGVDLLDSSTALIWHLAARATSFDTAIARDFDTVIVVLPTRARDQRFRIISIQRATPPQDAHSKLFESDTTHRVHIVSVGGPTTSTGVSTSIPLDHLSSYSDSAALTYEFFVDCLDSGLVQLANTAKGLGVSSLSRAQLQHAA